MNIDREYANKALKDLTAIAQNFAKERGLKASPLKLRFNSTGMTCKIELSVADLSPEQVEDKYKYMEFKPGDRVKSDRGDIFIITGITNRGCWLVKKEGEEGVYRFKRNVNLTKID